jgi:hypothetical protein
MAEKEKTNDTKVIKDQTYCIFFIISLIILSDLSTTQFRLIFKDKGHKSLEYCCLVIHLTSVISTISNAESNGGIFILIAPLGIINTNTRTNVARAISQQ